MATTLLVGEVGFMGEATDMCKMTCDADEYLDTDTIDGEDGTVVCKKCVPGTTRKAGDALVADGVTMVAGAAAPKMVNADTMSLEMPALTQCHVVYCPKDTHVDGKGGCCACEPGKTNTPTQRFGGKENRNLDSSWADYQDASNLGDPKECVAKTCAEDEYNTGKEGAYTCAVCETGKTNPAGDEQSSPVAGACSTPACGIIKGLFHRWDTSTKTCIACEAWETSAVSTKSTSTTTDAACAPLTCAKDQYVADDEFHTCQNCAIAEQTAPAGASRATPNSAACVYLTCAANQFVNHQKECSACPAGTLFSGAPLQRTQANKVLGEHVCTQSGSSDFHPRAVCAKDFHVVNHMCVACPAGSTNMGGDDPNSVVNSYCENDASRPNLDKHSACVIDTHVRAHACVKCPVGTTNAAGDDPHYFNTACTAEICHENFKVACTGDGDAKVCTCTACPAPTDAGAGVHLTNTAGDDCSKGVNTFCV